VYVSDRSLSTGFDFEAVTFHLSRGHIIILGDLTSLIRVSVAPLLDKVTAVVEQLKPSPHESPSRQPDSSSSPSPSSSSSSTQSPSASPPFQTVRDLAVQFSAGSLTLRLFCHSLSSLQIGITESEADVVAAAFENHSAFSPFALVNMSVGDIEAILKDCAGVSIGGCAVIKGALALLKELSRI
jgi:hypothetical protein